MIKEYASVCPTGFGLKKKGPRARGIASKPTVTVQAVLRKVWTRMVTAEKENLEVVLSDTVKEESVTIKKPQGEKRKGRSCNFQPWGLGG